MIRMSEIFTWIKFIHYILAEPTSSMVFPWSFAFFVFPYDDHFIKGNFACNYYHLICSYQKRIQNLVKHLQCRAFLQKSWWLLPANCFRKKPHVRCLTEFWIRTKYAPLFMFLITWFTRLSSCFINKKFN